MKKDNECSIIKRMLRKMYIPFFAWIDSEKNKCINARLQHIDAGDCDIPNNSNEILQIRSEYQWKMFCESLNNYNGYIEAATKMCKTFKKELIVLQGKCGFCGSEQGFNTFFSLENSAKFNNRENMYCLECGECSRKRIILELMKKIKMQKGNNLDVYIYEENEFTKKIRSIFPNTIGSEWLGANIKSGTIINGIRHEDSHCLSFEDSSFDLVVSCDVFEHVNDYKKTFQEVARVLKHKGMLIFTIPFFDDRDEITQRAEISDGNIVYYEKPVYHGNPISEDGSLVFWDYGWRLFDEIKDFGFSDIYMQPYYSRDHGHVGYLIPYYFVAVK